MAHLLIIGGSDAGISAALRARELDPGVEVTVLAADEFPNYSICGLPFFLSGEVADWHSLAHRTAADIEAEGIRLLLRHTARSVDAAAKRVEVLDADGVSRTLAYDRLVIATGAAPARPSFADDVPAGVYALHTMDDSFALYEHLARHAPRTAAIVGGGYIGLEMADALTHRGLDVTLIQRPASVLTTADQAFGDRVRDALEARGVRVATSVSIGAIRPSAQGLELSGVAGFRAHADVVVVATGVRPTIDLARSAGATLGVGGAVRVDRAMRTGVPDVFAAGDCVETWHRVLAAPTYLPLGTTAHKQGRIAGENAVGGDRQFAGSLGTQVVKVFDLAIARTGLLEGEARAAGFDPVTTELAAWDHKAYYPGARELRVRVTGDRRTGRLLGAQILGDYRAEVSKRIDVFATALFHGMTVEGMADLDLSYTPPLSSPWDPVQMGAQAWTREQARERVTTD